MGSTVLIVAEGRDGSLRKVSYELVSVAIDMAKGLGGAVEAVVIGGAVAKCALSLAKTGVAKVYQAEGAAQGNAVAQTVRHQGLQAGFRVLGQVGRPPRHSVDLLQSPYRQVSPRPA